MKLGVWRVPTRVEMVQNGLCSRRTNRWTNISSNDFFQCTKPNLFLKMFPAFSSRKEKTSFPGNRHYISTTTTLFLSLSLSSSPTAFFQSSIWKLNHRIQSTTTTHPHPIQVTHTHPYDFPNFTTSICEKCVKDSLYGVYNIYFC